MANLYSVFKDLVPSYPLLVGDVTADDGDTHQVTLVGGGVMMVRGKATVGDKVFIRDGVIEGTAPNLPVETIEI